ncbi:MAG: hypothetical protein JSR18_06685 [Proteobacteria bacterium]|nr:hypothetical protein [Pseudomonadota bacterium]
MKRAAFMIQHTSAKISVRDYSFRTLMSAPKNKSARLPVSTGLESSLDSGAELTGTSTPRGDKAHAEEDRAWRIPQLQKLDAAIAEADAGDIAMDAEVSAMKKKWGYAG